MLLLAVATLILHRMTAGQTLGYFFSGITYSSTLVYRHFNLLNPVIWSLEVEIQFYILAPFITYWIFGIKDFTQRNILITAAILLTIFIQEQTGISSAANVLRFTILGQLQYFLLGIFMVNFYLEQKLKPAGYTRWWDGAATIAVFSMIAFRWVTGFGKTMLFIFVLAVLFNGAFRAGAFSRFIKRPWVMAIGGMCYSIYLLHLAIAQACIEFILTINHHSFNSLWWFTIYTLLFLFCLVLVVPVFYLLVEKPCMDHGWPARLKNFIKSKTGRSLSLEKTAGKPPGADKV